MIVLPVDAAGLTLTGDDTFGELDVRALLAVFGVPRLDRAGEGWGGGRSAIYRSGREDGCRGRTRLGLRTGRASNGLRRSESYVDEAFDAEVTPTAVRERVCAGLAAATQWRSSASAVGRRSCWAPRSRAPRSSLGRSSARLDAGFAVYFRAASRHCGGHSFQGLDLRLTVSFLISLSAPGRLVRPEQPAWSRAAPTPACDDAGSPDRRFRPSQADCRLSGVRPEGVPRVGDLRQRFTVCKPYVSSSSLYRESMPVMRALSLSTRVSETETHTWRPTKNCGLRIVRHTPGDCPCASSSSPFSRRSSELHSSQAPCCAGKRRRSSSSSRRSASPPPQRR